MSPMIGGTSWRRALLLMTAVLAGGCKADLCESKPPAFQLDLSLPASVDRARVKSFRVDVNAGGKHKEQLFEVKAGALTGSETSVSVTVGAAGTAGFAAEVVVDARDDQGNTLARAHGTLKGVGNACNFFKLVLAASPPDGGPDLPVPDGRPDAPGDLPADQGQPDQPRDLGPRERPPDKPASDTRPPDGPKIDQPKLDMKKIDQPKPDMPKPDMKKPDMPKPDMKKPDSTVVLKTCATLYNTAPYYTLCTESATSCVFYTSTYPNAGTTCNAVCGAACTGAATPQGYSTTTQRCTSIGTITCSTTTQSRICTCNRVP